MDPHTTTTTAGVRRDRRARGRARAARALAAVVLAACSESSAISSTQAVSSAATLAVSVSATFGGSARICGSRPDPGVGHVCRVALPTPCPCFDFDSSGQLIDPTTDEPVLLTDLCPSDIGTPGDWTFSYELFAEPQCQGEQINDVLHREICYDAKDLLTQSRPNQSVEALVMGDNANKIVCAAEQATKDWGFAACEQIIRSGDLDTHVKRYDCGCEALTSVCTCGEGGVGPGQLEPGCEFDKQTCDIVCADEPPDTFQCDDTMYMLTGSPSTLSILDRSTFTLRPVATYTELLNALGARAQDGFLYAVTDRTGGKTQSLVRITGDGHFTDLGEVPGLVGECRAGAFALNGLLIVFAKDLGGFALIDVETVTIATLLVPPVPATGPVPNFADIAINPVDGSIWGYDDAGDTLGTFSRTTGEFQPKFGPVYPNGNTLWVTGAAFFNNTGTLYMYGSKLSPGAGPQRFLFSIDVSTGAISQVGTGPTVSNTDGATCVKPVMSSM